MPDGLHDENRPPSAVVEIAANNEARRNDGTVLSSSGENPWYVLATVAGEQRAGGNVAPSRALHARNRRIWNGWICKDLPVTERAKLAEKLGWSELDFAPLNAAEMKLLTARFQAAFGVQDITAVLPDPKSNIDFSSLFFPCIVFLNQFYFPNKVDFSTSNFAGPAIFEGAYFEDEVDFRKTHFQSAAALVSAHVSGAALFAETYFEANSVFKDTRFNDYAVFQKAHFHQ